VLSRGVSNVWGRCRRLVSYRLPGANGKRLPIHDDRWEAAGKYGHVGWHTFRHTYRCGSMTRVLPSTFNKS
jgi:hypothetical protein